MVYGIGNVGSSIDSWTGIYYDSKWILDDFIVANGSVWYLNVNIILQKIIWWC